MAVITATMTITMAVVTTVIAAITGMMTTAVPPACRSAHGHRQRRRDSQAQYGPLACTTKTFGHDFLSVVRVDIRLAGLNVD
jgi:hypothetical protein